MKKSVVGLLVALVVALGAPASGVVIGPGSSGVEGIVTDLGGGVFQYDYTVYSGGSTDLAEGAIAPAFDPIFAVGGVIDSFLIPFFDPEAVAIIPGSLVAPPGWLAAFRNTADSFWDYNPLDDPDSGNYEVPASEFIAPPFVLEFYADDAPINPGAVAPADSLEIGLVGFIIGGFSFQSNYSDTNGPVVVRDVAEAIIFLDPPHVESPSHPVPEPAGLGLIGLLVLAVRKRRS